ncbi:hypothetical protein LOK74_15225 [Brevibacillus humidisoli]|uniref:hypothetical protein n=1 Tax=Brevibacillus humidisoli TaxID=2895522 RepID=UPI001E49A0D7|nr:hypothetical protein [Brevibacillus humidisoli]UFJ39415.1 hypothetical protein LOK74_15225 [Brevibacillus humidisoli]
MNVYRQDGKVIFKSSADDVYRVREHDVPKWQRKGDMPHPPEAVEQVFDALMGHMRELATVERETDGGQQAALHLSGSQIPEVVHALGTLIASKVADGERWDHGKATFDMKANLPKLTENIKVEAINLDAQISPDNLLEQQTAEINITGTDDSGKHHRLSIQLQADFSDYDQTVPEQIDLTGKKITEVESEGTRHGWRWPRPCCPIRSWSSWTNRPMVLISKEWLIFAIRFGGWPSNKE